MKLLDSPISRWMVAGTLGGFIVGVITAVIVLIVPPRFNSTVSFAPEQQSQSPLRSLGGFGAIFGQLGLDALTNSGQTLAFYRHLAQSDDVLTTVVTTPIPAELDAGAETLADLWYPDEVDREKQIVKAMRRLRNDRMHVRADDRTGIITISALARDRHLAQWITATAYHELDRYNIAVRRSRAQMRREFLDARVRDAQDSLQAAEAALERFYERNRVFRDSPDLIAREQRLVRNAEARQEIVTALWRELESARVDEVRDTPVLNVIQQPSLSVFRATPRRTRTTILLAMLGGILAIVLEIGRPWVTNLIARIRPRSTSS